MPKRRKIDRLEVLARAESLLRQHAGELRKSCMIGDRAWRCHDCPAISIVGGKCDSRLEYDRLIRTADDCSDLAEHGR